MKTKNIIFTAITLCLLIGIMGCGDETYAPPSDPKQAILGKWELIEIGNWPNMFPCEPSYIVFLQDSLVKQYDYESGEFVMLPVKYWIDSLLHIGKVKYSYIFYEDKVRLDFVEILAINNTFIYQRKK